MSVPGSFHPHQASGKGEETTRQRAMLPRLPPSSQIILLIFSLGCVISHKSSFFKSLIEVLPTLSIRLLVKVTKMIHLGKLWESHTWLAVDIVKSNYHCFVCSHSATPANKLQSSGFLRKWHVDLHQMIFLIHVASACFFLKDYVDLLQTFEKRFWKSSWKSIAFNYFAFYV